MVVGYLRAHLVKTENEMAATTNDLMRCVEKAGYTLGRVWSSASAKYLPPPSRPWSSS